MSSSSVKRVFSSVRAVINLAISEHGLSAINVFSGTFIPDDDVKKKRLPIPNNALLSIQRECMALDDEPRWLIALISDTGMRLSEACGLQASDIHLEGNTPHINLVEHPWRRLKTTSSSRQVPLSGSVPLGSTEDPSNWLYPRLPQILQRSQVQCQLSKCSTE